MHTLSPLDGRYKQDTKKLRGYFSEASFLSYLFFVEVEYFVALGQTKEIKELSELNNEQINLLRSWYKNMNKTDIEKIKEIENTTKHDLKAVEYFFKEKLDTTDLKLYKEFIHFALTSDDTKNIAQALMLKQALNNIILPELENMQNLLLHKAQTYKQEPMLALTHGQPATPTTVGKEFFVFYKRLEKQILNLKQIRITAKLNGATGNYSAHTLAYPNIDWPKFSNNFIKQFGLETNFFTTQIEPHDSLAEIFSCLAHINNILKNLSQDLWYYISRNIFTQKISVGQVGSSTMPHKINPIDFENAEGNLGLANALLNFMSDKLTVSRMQRDLSDSTILRNIGSAFGYCLIAYSSLQKGLNKIEINQTELEKELNNHPEILAEAIQTILRKHGQVQAYEKLKKLTQGQDISIETLKKFITELDIPEFEKDNLLKLTPDKYIGLADKLIK